MKTIDPVKRKLGTYNNTINDCKYENFVTTSMPRTFLMGNGDVALTSSGDKRAKEYLISKGDFWSCGDLKTDDVMGFNTRRVTPLTIGKIRIENLTSEKSFYESLDIASGVLETKYDGVIVQCFCHSMKNVIIIKLKAKHNTSIIFSVSVKSDVPEYQSNAFCENDKYYIKRRTANFAPENPVSWTSEVVLTAKALCGEITLKGCGNGAVAYDAALEAGKETIICVALGGGGKNYDPDGGLLGESPIKQADDLLESCKNISEITESHLNWWDEYWCKSYVNLSDFEMEKYYYGSLYLMACCSRENKLAPGIFGNFITTDNPKWNGDYHMNYNFIAPFYGMYAANRAEFAKPLKDPVIDFLQEGKRRAKADVMKISSKYIKGGKVNGVKLKGREDLIKGIDDAVLYPVALGPYGAYTWSKNGGYLTQMNDCAFTAMGITAYYFYTLDEKYFKEIEELLRLNVNFFLAWREKEMLDNGKYRYNIWSGAHEGTMELNSPHVLASIKNILKCLIDGYRRGYSDKNTSQIAVWTDFLENLADFPIRHFKYKKRFKTIFKGDVVPLGEKGLNTIKDSATVSLEFIHPGEELDFTSDEKLKSASRNLVTAHKLMSDGIFRQINNLPKIFIHAIRAEYDSKVIVKEFKNLYENDFMYNYSVKDFWDTHGIEKAGGIEFINSMLLSSDMKIIKVFPNWLKDRNAEFYNMRARGAFLVSSKYNSQKKCIEYIEVASLVQDEISFVNPFKSVVIKDENDNKVEFINRAESFAGSVVSFKAKTNEKYIITGK